MLTGKWCLRADAASTLGVNEKAFNKQVKLGNTHIFREYGSKVHVPRPFNQNVFYYVSDNGIMNANESKTLTLPQWVHMWKSAQLERHANKDDDWSKTFLAPQIWTNLRITCCGFLGYRRQVLSQNAKVVKKVYMSHSNLSSLEGTFLHQ
jgi:hypothetical protein